MTDRALPPSRPWSDEDVLELVGEHERVVRAYLSSIGCPPERLEDLAQETFLRLFSRPVPGGQVTNLGGYLCVVARNLFLNSLRRDAGTPELREFDEAWAEYHGSDGGAGYLEALQGCLESLPERTREALRLRYGDGASRSRIAADLELSLGGVKSLILRGKESLRACIQRRLGGASLGRAEVSR